MSATDLKVTPPPDTTLPPRPFYPKALVCFIISLLCLAWLVSLQMQSERHANPGAPAPRNDAAQQPLLPVKAAAPARQLTETDIALAEIDAIQALAQEENPASLKNIVN